MDKVSYITSEGLKKLVAEVEYLKSVERPRISQAIAEARDKGDLSENAEYDAAKEAQGLLEMKISQCRACGAEIMFIKSVAGKTIPVNAEQITYQQKAGGSLKVVTPNGEVISGELAGDPQKATGIGFISHFATCPEADKFRKPRKSDRKKG